MLKRKLLAALVLSAAATPVLADVTPNGLFSDHAVLQAGKPVPVWGTAAAGEHVNVTINGLSTGADAGPDGKWSATLAPMPAGGPFTMTIAGKNTVTVNDVLVGEVWLASGQSNMEYGIYNADAKVAKEAKDDQLRFFFVSRAGSLTPLDAVHPDRPLAGKWVVTTPENLQGAGNWNGVSAVGFYFGQSIRKSTGHAVGVLESYWGGTRSQAWTPADAFAGDPSTMHYAEEVKKTADRTDVKFPFYWADFAPIKNEWHRQTDAEYQPKLNAWKEQVKAAKAANQPEPPKPVPPIPEPPDPNWHGTPGILYNGMITPLQPYAIKGVIWYQGESNAGSAKEYRTIFPMMIESWRKAWGGDNFPFLFVQIAPFKDMGPQIREAQLMTLTKSSNTGMAVTTDVGEANDIHPKKKQPVGERLALAARAIAYGEKIEYSGPLFDSATFTDGRAIVHFTHVGQGLEAKDGALRGFTIAGDDKKFVPATAEIEGDTVVVRADGVDKPSAVRYGWANVPDVNLWNKDGLPASPFRSNPD